MLQSLHRPTSELPSRWSKYLGAAALIVALALTIGRASINETLRDPDTNQQSPSQAPPGPGPSTSVAIDLALCVPALLVLTRRAIDREYRLSTHGSHLLFAALAVWALASTAWSSDRFAACIEAFHLVAAAALMWAATQLFRDGRRLRLLAGAALAVMLIYTAHGLIYHWVDVPEEVKYWQEHRDEELKRRGWASDSFEAQQFEKKLTAGEMIGFNSSPNSFAATLVMLGIVVAGLIIQRIVDRDEIGWPICLALPLIPAAFVGMLSYSKAAAVSPLLAGAALAAIWLFSHRLRGQRRILYVTGVALSLLLVGAVAAVGSYRGGLFGASLTFRWHYWVSAARLFELHPALGVGWTNFGAHYLSARLPVAAEEVKDPHNLVVRAFVELGIVGGALMIGWLARLAWELLAPADEVPALLHVDRKTTGQVIAITAALATVIGILATVDLTGATDVWYALMLVLQRVLYFGLTLLALAIATLRSSELPILDNRPAPWIERSAAVALAIFLIHNLIDFSIFEPGPMTLFALVAGAALARKDQLNAPTNHRLSLAALGGGVLLWLAAAVLLLVPVISSETRAASGNSLIAQGQLTDGAQQFQDAFNGLWISNADYEFRAAYALERAGAAADQVVALLNAAIAADPTNVAYYLNRGTYRLAQPNPDPKAVLEDFAAAVKLNPNEISIRVDYASALANFGQSQRAIEQLRAALDYNNLFDVNEPKRLSKAKIAEIAQLIQRLSR